MNYMLSQLVFSAELQVVLLFITTGLLLAGVGQFIRNLQFERVHRCFLALARFFRWEVYPKNNRLGSVYMQVPSIKGFFLDKQCNVLVSAKGGGRLRSYYTTFKIRVKNPHNRTMSILREDFFQKVNKWIGKQDIIIGDPEVDHFFILRSDEPTFIYELLNEEVKDQLKKSHLSFNGSINLNEHELSYTEKSLITKPADIRRFARLIQLMLCLAERLDNIEIATEGEHFVNVSKETDNGI